MHGLELELRCDVPELSGGNVYAYQLDNVIDYNTAWNNFNHWWGFLPSLAGTMCPPKDGKDGIVTWTTGDLPPDSRPVQECGMQKPSHDDTVPAYVWGYPSIGAFVLAQGAPGSSFATLHSWVTGKASKPGKPPVNLLDIIPSDVQQDGSCHSVGSAVGASAVFQCSDPRGLAANTIIYYQFASQQLLSNGFSNFLKLQNFQKTRECTTGNDFTDFLTECQTDFHNQTPFMTGSIAEYTSTSNEPIIVASDNQKNVMAVMVGTNPGDLLSYWKQLTWVV